MPRIKMRRQKPRTSDDGYPQGVNRAASAFWDFHAAPYRMLGNLIRYGHLAHTTRILGEFDNPKRPLVRVVDVGCGNAEMVPWLGSIIRPAGTRWEYLGLDLDEEKLREIPNLIGRRGNVGFIRCDLREGFPRGHKEVGIFDVAICAEVLEHMREDEAGVLCKSLLRYAKWFIGTVPDPKFGSAHVAHVNEMTTEAVWKMVCRSGWIPKFIGNLGVRFPIDGTVERYMHRDVFRQFSGMQENLLRYLHQGCPWPKHRRGKWTYFVAENPNEIRSR